MKNRKKQIAKTLLSVLVLLNVLLIYSIAGFSEESPISRDETIDAADTYEPDTNISNALNVSSNKWYYQDILFADEHGWLNSIDRNTYNPEGDITLHEFTELCLAFAVGTGIDNPIDGAVTGEDLLEGIAGLNEDSGRDILLSKRDAARIICNLLKLGPSINKTVYMDTNDKYAQKLYDEAILRTYPVMGKYYFKPERTLTEAEAVALLVTACKFVNSPQEFEDFKRQKPDKSIKLPILEYHSLSENPDKWSDYVISPEKFTGDMKLIKSLGYTTVSISEVAAFMEGYKRQLPQKPIIITFDDGYSDNYYYAFSIAQQLDINLEIFVIGNNINFYGSRGNSNFLTFEEMLEMSGSGLVGFQNHTFSMHSAKVQSKHEGGLVKGAGESASEYTDRILRDMDTSKNFIQDYLGCRVESLSYPYGIYNSMCEKALEKEGYEMTLTSSKGINCLTDGLYMLKRIPMPDSLDRDKLREQLS